MDSILTVVADDEIYYKVENNLLLKAVADGIMQWYSYNRKKLHSIAAAYMDLEEVTIFGVSAANFCVNMFDKLLEKYEDAADGVWTSAAVFWEAIVNMKQFKISLHDITGSLVAKTGMLPTAALQLLQNRLVHHGRIVLYYQFEYEFLATEIDALLAIHDFQLESMDTWTLSCGFQVPEHVFVKLMTRLIAKHEAAAHNSVQPKVQLALNLDNSLETCG